MQIGTPKTTEQEVYEVFGWSEPNIFAHRRRRILQSCSHHADNLYR